MSQRWPRSSINSGKPSERAYTLFGTCCRRALRNGRRDPLRRHRFFICGYFWRPLSSLLPGHAEATLDQRIFLELRLPRTILCLFVGASLGRRRHADAGAVSHPIVEPGLVGTSSGAAFGSAFFLSSAVRSILPTPLELASCCMSRRRGLDISCFHARTLTRGRSGVDRYALADRTRGECTLYERDRLLSYLARDPQARSITFWSLGTLSGAKLAFSLHCRGFNRSRNGRRTALFETTETPL